MILTIPILTLRGYENDRVQIESHDDCRNPSEIIRLAAVVKLLDRHVNHKMIHTGQNYDYELNQVFFDDLGLRRPDYYLGVDTSSLGHVLGETLIKVEAIFHEEKPDAVLILGDTNAAVAGIMARRMKIPIYHMEAGNRSYDFNVPEEINRRIIDHIADFNLVYTENSRRHLLAEGLPQRQNLRHRQSDVRGAESVSG
ncbi:MAG: UDP-N-acetylglucosamine 2-epimerase [Victivallis sp.]